MMMRVFSHICLALLLAACTSPKLWYADATLYISRRPPSSICELTQDAVLIRGGAANALRDKRAYPSTPSSTSNAKAEQLPRIPTLHEGDHILLLPNTYTANKKQQKIPAGTQLRLHMVYIEKLSDEPTYVVYADTSLPDESESIWIPLAWGSKPRSFPLLQDAYGEVPKKPLRLNLPNLLDQAVKHPLSAH